MSSTGYSLGASDGTHAFNWNMAVSTGVSMGLMSTAGPMWSQVPPKTKTKIVKEVVEKIVEVAPKVDPFCEWCGSLWFPATYRRGCCDMCGGPRSTGIPAHVEVILNAMRKQSKVANEFDTIKWKMALGEISSDYGG